MNIFLPHRQETRRGRISVFDHQSAWPALPRPYVKGKAAGVQQQHRGAGTQKLGVAVRFWYRTAAGHFACLYQLKSTDRRKNMAVASAISNFTAARPLR